MKHITLLIFLMLLFVGTTSHAQDLAWQQTESYTAPNFKSFFTDSEEGGALLDALWESEDKNARTDKEILETVRGGLWRTEQHRTLILRWIGNRYIWEQSPQNPDAIEIMYHAADFSGESADPFGSRHYGVYFGLSVVTKKSPAILRTLAELCMRVDDPNDLGRVAWGASSQRDELIAYLQPYLNSKDTAISKKAEVCKQIFLGKLKAFAWATQQAKERVEATYAKQLPEIKEALVNGNSDKRKDTLRLIASERISLIMDDSFIHAFAACANDSDHTVRNQVAIIVGDKWVWSAEAQHAEAIDLMLRLSKDTNREVRYNAVYYGLSTVRDKTDLVIRRLLVMAFIYREHNLYGRIVWGLQNDRERVAEILDEYIRGTDTKLSARAKETYKDMIEKNYTKE